MTNLLDVVPGLEAALKPPTDGADFTAIAVTLSPDDVQAMLTQIGLLSDDDFDWAHVGMMADMMQAGEWVPLGQIAIAASAADEFKLVDGHHRLRAAVLASWTAEWLVTCLWNQNCSAHDLYRRLNLVSTPRTDADIGHAVFGDQLSEKMQSIIITAARYQNEWDTGYQLPEFCHWPPIRDNVARARYRAEAFKKADLIINDARVLDRVKRRLFDPMVMAVVAETLVTKPDHASIFWKAVVSGGQGVAGELRTRLIRGRPRGSSEHYWPRLVGQAWNDHMANLGVAVPARNPSPGPSQNERPAPKAHDSPAPK